MNIIVKAIGGSRLYGINRNDSDMDIRGVFIEPLSDLVFPGVETIEEKPDIVYHSLRKFARLLIANNPSALELLFTPDTHILEYTEAWKNIRLIQKHILSRRVIKSYGGFLTSQLRNFEKDSSDRKAVVHAWRLAIQLVNIVYTGTLDPELRSYAREIIADVYNGDKIETTIGSTRLLLQEAEANQHLLPEQPDEQYIKELITDIYYGYSIKEITYGNN